MTQQAARGPACPVVILSSSPPRPRSSTPSWMTMALLSTLVSPLSFTRWSSILTTAFLSSSAATLPRSPTCLSTTPGAPWLLPKGLKWPPAPAQLSDRSPASWMWKPCSPGLRPVTSPDILTSKYSSPSWALGPPPLSYSISVPSGVSYSVRRREPLTSPVPAPSNSHTAVRAEVGGTRRDSRTGKRVSIVSTQWTGWLGSHPLLII